MFDRLRFNKEVKEWLTTNQEIRRTTYNDLGEDSIVFDLGGFEGNWSDAMIKKYGVNSYVFEIMPLYYQNLIKKFSNQPKCKVFDFGLAGSNRTERTSKENVTDGFSAFENNNSTKIDINFKSAKEFLEDNGISKIDVCKINIEGGEYELLEHILDNELQTMMRNIQVQFHWQYPINNFYERWVEIRRRLEKTHKTTYDYYFTWENWSLNDEYNK